MKLSFKSLFAVVVTLVMVFGILGCGKEAPPPPPVVKEVLPTVSWETQEASRAQALKNARFNANVFRNELYPDMNIVLRGDSTIGPTCASGDGWVSVDLTKKGSTEVVVSLKCHSVSASIGCMTEADFKKRPSYSKEEGTCNKNLPFPLPKIEE
jgi:hypothetical protein